MDYRKAARLGVFLWFKALPIFAVYGADYSACPVFPAWLDALAALPALTALPALAGACAALALSAGLGVLRLLGGGAGAMGWSFSSAMPTSNMRPSGRARNSPKRAF